MSSINLFTWSFRYVSYNNQIVLAEVEYDLNRIVGWSHIEEEDKEEATAEASGFLPILVECPPFNYHQANHPEVVEWVVDETNKALADAPAPKPDYQPTQMQELLGALVFGLDLKPKPKAKPALKVRLRRVSAPAPTPVEFKVLVAPSLASTTATSSPAPAPYVSSNLIQKWIARHQESLDLSSGMLELKVVNPNAFSGVLDRLINGVLHSFSYEEREDRLNKAEKTLPKATRARGNNSKPKGKRPWRNR